MKFIYKRKKINIITILLIFITLASCSTSRTYTLKQSGSDQIINGSVQKAVLMNKNKFPWFNSEYANYIPNEAILGQLKIYVPEIRVLIFAGTWCSDTQRELPRFYKIMAAIGVNEAQMELIMLDQNKKSRYFNVEVLAIENIPTFIFLKNGKEVGRIIEKPNLTLEEDILNYYKAQ
ncbi:MAG: thioredoxin family protein [Bacteroidia bacterium]|nr:thioredoxin family protein [Bacteroidia bacterium]MCF8426055.1 thioredoxin family protein [Bacteroidia bacterium]MCF8445350.1 thioredoxin family protein [Bacteroidia bacterium]